jgi:transcriptional regulator with XRE-family HTH domain
MIGKQERKKMDYREKIKAIRKASGLTVEKFVVIAGLSKRGFFYLLSGEHKPRTLTAQRIDELVKEYGVKDHGNK